MELKIKNLAGNVFEMDEFVKSKESETNYRQLASNISALVEDLGLHVRKSMV